MALNPITDISVSKIYVLNTEPTNKTKDRFWFDTTNNILKRYTGTVWKPISVSSDDVVVLSDGSKISLTTYLNNQISALAEGIDTKQKKLSTYSETVPTDKSYPEEVVITAKGQDLLASNGAGIITLSATDSSDSEDGFAAGTINLNATKVQKKGKDIATTDDLANKQDKLQFYTESGESTSSLAKITASNFEVKTTEIKLNSDNGISGNILEKTISKTSSDTKIPTAKAVYTAVNAKANKSTTLSGYGITNAYTKTEVDTEIGKKQDISDSSLTTNDKTIVGAINELNSQVNTTIPEPITSVYTISSTALSSIISNTNYAGVSGQILISANIANVGPILVGESLTDKANAFPVYPDQIFPIPFSDINNFKVTGNVGDKFNYIISFRSLSNSSPVANGGITILNENGYYKLTPEGDGDTATLVIKKLK